MQLKYIVLVLTAWILITLLVGVAEHVVVGGAVDPVTGAPQATSVLSALSDGNFFERANALAHMVTFNFPAIFDGPWTMLQWILFVPFVTAFGIMLLGYILAHIPVIGRGGG